RHKSPLLLDLGHGVKRPVLAVDLLLGEGYGAGFGHGAVRGRLSVHRKFHRVNVLAALARLFVVGAGAVRLFGVGADRVPAPSALTRDQPDRTLLGELLGGGDDKAPFFPRVHRLTLFVYFIIDINSRKSMME